MIYSPLEQFQILPVFNFLFIFTNSSVFITLIFLFLTLYIKLPKRFIPTRFQQLFETIFSVVSELSYANIGSKGRYFLPLIFALFLFILLVNIIGIIPYSFTLTSHLIVTFSLALTIYIGFNIIGIRKHGVQFFNLLLPSGSSLALVPLLVPIEFVSYIFRVISLPVRLFANMMAGHTLLKVIAGFAWSMMLSSSFFIFISHFIPLIMLVLLFGLELGIACIQAYVFSILTCMYINDASNLH